MSHSKVDQIVRLRETLKKWRKQALKKAHSFSDVRSQSKGSWGSTAQGAGVVEMGSGGGGGGSGRSFRRTRRSLSMPTLGGEGKVGRVPAGHLAVYVGEERRRFVIKMRYLSHPLFRALLKKTEEEMGFHQEGALAIPCHVSFFEHLLLLIDPCRSHHHHHHHHSVHLMSNLLHITHPHPDHLHHYPLPHHQLELLHELLLDSSSSSSSSSHLTSTPHLHCPSPPLSNLTLSLSSLHFSSLLGASQA